MFITFTAIDSQRRESTSAQPMAPQVSDGREAPTAGAARMWVATALRNLSGVQLRAAARISPTQPA